MAKLEFTTKPLSLSQRIECNRVKTTVEPDAEGYIIINVMWNKVNYIRAGLDTLNGVKITKDNFEEELNNLSDAEILKIGNDIYDKANFSKKKKS